MPPTDASAFIPQHFIANFYQALDAGDVSKAASFFAVDGVWRRKGEALTGPQQVATALEKRDPARITCHTISTFTADQHKTHRWVTRYYLTVFENHSENGLNIAAIFMCEDEIAFIDDAPKIVSKTSQKRLPAATGIISTPNV